MTDPEAAVVNLFLVVRVCLVGGILLVLPRITRKGLVFGTYVGEALAEDAEVLELLRSWKRGCFMLMGLSLVVGLGISVAGWPVPGNLTGTAVLLSCAPLLYFRMFLKARELAPPTVARQANVASASLAAGSSRTSAFARITLAFCSLTGLATIAYAALSYEDLPARLATYSNLFGLEPELTAEKSLLAVLYLPLASLVLSGSFAAISVLITGAKRSLRAGSGGRSAAAQETFHAIQVQTFSGTALCISLNLTLLSVHFVRIGLGQMPSLGIELAWTCGAMLVFMVGSLVRILRGSGQGGALLEEGSEEAPLTGGLADNAHWVGGAFYVNKNDPSMLLESRFGIGYSMNFGNWKAVLFLCTYTLLFLVLLALPFMGVVR